MPEDDTKDLFYNFASLIRIKPTLSFDQNKNIHFHIDEDEDEEEDDDNEDYGEVTYHPLSPI